MVAEFHNIESDKPMTSIFNYILKESGGSIASLGGSLAVVFTFIGNLSDWVAICGGAVALVGGCLGIYSKFLEIKFKNLQMIEFQKTAERDNKFYEDLRLKSEREALVKEAINEIKKNG